MNCQEAVPLLEALADGELEEATRGALERHLTSCAACRQRNQAFAELRSAVRAVRPEGATPGLAARLLSSPPRASRDPRRRWVWGAVAGALAAAASLAMCVTRPGSQSPALRPEDRSLADYYQASAPEVLLREPLNAELGGEP